MTVRAWDVNIRKELDIQAYATCPVTCGTTQPSGVVREIPGFPASGLGGLSLSENLP